MFTLQHDIKTRHKIHSGDVFVDKNKTIYLLGGCECTELWRKIQFCVENIIHMEKCN